MRYCLVVIVFTFLIVVGCKKQNNSAIPEIAVNIDLYINNPSYFNLNPVGGWVYVTGGVRGIIVYRFSPTEFVALDRNCTYLPNSVSPCAKVYVDSTNIQAVDSCCNSRFLIMDGSVLNGPAALPLKKYNTTFDGSVVHIYN